MAKIISVVIHLVISFIRWEFFFSSLNKEWNINKGYANSGNFEELGTSFIFYDMHIVRVQGYPFQSSPSGGFTYSVQFSSIQFGSTSGWLVILVRRSGLQASHLTRGQTDNA